MDVLFHRNFAGRALVPQGNGLILPLLEIGFPDLLDPHSGSVAFVVLVVNGYCLITGNFGFVVFCSSQFLAVAGLPLGDSFAVVGIVRLRTLTYCLFLLG